ncbi:MAG: lamin tail domain-containing protein [Verrucomicrobia bacterium]|nr:lamin tail domain-containing protein [Verrucomicrobiota bacterium]
MSRWAFTRAERGFTTYTVVVPVPAATPLGAYCAYGTVTVGFSDGLTLSASGDTVVCIVAQAPGQPTVPRLSLTLLSDSAPRVAPGDMTVARYLVKNNDPIRSVSLTAIAGSRQSAVRPQGANELQGVFAISNPFGDDFPILFNPGNSCIPLPSHPYTQQPISNALPVLAPGQSSIVTVGMRSYGQCANGSCSESTLRVTGVFADNTPALGCAGMALVVDASVPSGTCAGAVNDCNHNGIPDAVDIANGTSQDRNFNSMPDECEQVIVIPGATSVTPSSTSPGAPIVVRAAFTETVPLSIVWANGIVLSRSGFFWQGSIPADTRPGPQTVYFLGKDQLGGLTTQIAIYQVVPPPRPPVTINEWLASPEPPQLDFIELFNASASPFDLSGYFLTDDLLNPTKFSIPSGTVIAAGGFLAFDQTQLGFSLSGAGESVGLSTPGGVMIDSFTFGSQLTGVSQGRWPNGGPNIYSMRPTPKASNIPLVITGQPSDQTVAVGAPATFRVVAMGLSPFTYQWFKNGEGIAGATADNYTIANVQASDAGKFFVRVTHAAGNLDSRVAILVVQPPSVIVSEAFSPSGNLTPPNAVYSSPANAGAVSFPNGIVIRNISHGRLSFHPPPPVLNGTQTYSSGGEVRFELSLNGGSTFTPVTAPADVVVRQTTSADDGTARLFRTEMISLNIAGGNLPAGVRVRESPTLVSPGQAASRLVPTGGAVVSGFFDVLLEVSLNNGATWTPATIPARIVLGIESPENLSVTANASPPNFSDNGPPGATPQTNVNGLIIQHVRLRRLALTPTLPPPGGSLVYTSTLKALLDISINGGVSFSEISTPGSISVRLTGVKDDGASRFFDTEVISLDITGGTFPVGLRIRESPTLASRGRATSRAMPGGGAMISAFFDVITEISADGGVSWTPGLAPLRAERTEEAPENFSASQNLSPAAGSYASSLSASPITFGDGRFVGNLIVYDLSPHPAAPPLGGSLVHILPASPAQFRLSLDGERSDSNILATALPVMKITHVLDLGASQFFDLELLALDISGGTLPTGTRLRISPVKPSLGQGTMRRTPLPHPGGSAGDYLISGFFDVWTEFSANNGATWTPATSSLRLKLASRRPLIERSATNVLLLWSSGEFCLQGATRLETRMTNTVWTLLPGPSAISLPATGAQRFFRMIAPCPPSSP